MMLSKVVPPVIGGVTLFVGCPGSGKTTLARDCAFLDCEKNGRPIVVVDPSRVDQLKCFPHATGLEATVREAWGVGSHVAYTPQGEDEFDGLMAAARAGKDVILLLDELRFFASAHYLSRELTLACRMWKHSNLSVYGTTQHVGDLHAELLAVVTNLVVFRVTSPRGLERLQREYGLAPDVVSQLPQFEYLTVRVGF